MSHTGRIYHPERGGSVSVGMEDDNGYAEIHLTVRGKHGEQASVTMTPREAAQVMVGLGYAIDYYPDARGLPGNPPLLGAVIAVAPPSQTTPPHLGHENVRSFVGVDFSGGGSDD